MMPPSLLRAILRASRSLTICLCYEHEKSQSDSKGTPVEASVKDAANREPHYPEYETDLAHMFLIHCFPRVKLRRFPVHRAVTRLSICVQTRTMVLSD